MAPLCEWIRQGKLDWREFVTHEFPLERFHEGLDAVKSGKALKILYRY